MVLMQNREKEERKQGKKKINKSESVEIGRTREQSGLKKQTSWDVLIQRWCPRDGTGWGSMLEESGIDGSWRSTSTIHRMNITHTQSGSSAARNLHPPYTSCFSVNQNQFRFNNRHVYQRRRITTTCGITWDGAICMALIHVPEWNMSHSSTPSVSLPLSVCAHEWNSFILSHSSPSHMSFSVCVYSFKKTTPSEDCPPSAMSDDVKCKRKKESHQWVDLGLSPGFASRCQSVLEQETKHVALW